MHGWVDLSWFLKEWLQATSTGFCIPCCFIILERQKQKNNNRIYHGDDSDEEDEWKWSGKWSRRLWWWWWWWWCISTTSSFVNSLNVVVWFLGDAIFHIRILLGHPECDDDKNTEGISWWCHISHNDATLNHFKCVLWWQKYRYILMMSYFR